MGIKKFKSATKVDASMSVNITDIDTGIIHDIVPDRRKKYLRDYFLSYTKEARKNVKMITTDMYPTYIELAKELFPNAMVVLDKFHIVQLFTRNMNKLRINEMKKFKTNTHEYQEILLCIKFCDIEKFEEILNRDPSMRPEYFRVSINSLKKYNSANMSLISKQNVCGGYILYLQAVSKSRLVETLMSNFLLKLKIT